MASVMAATIKTYHLSSAVTDRAKTNAAGVVTAVTFTGSPHDLCDGVHDQQR
ncbi:MAG: hypothetical protein ACLUJU_05295 [Subdoligranulum sp.]